MHGMQYGSTVKPSEADGQVCWETKLPKVLWLRFASEQGCYVKTGTPQSHGAEDQTSLHQERTRGGQKGPHADRANLTFDPEGAR